MCHYPWASKVRDQREIVAVALVKQVEQFLGCHQQTSKYWSRSVILVSAFRIPWPGSSNVQPTSGHQNHFAHQNNLRTQEKNENSEAFLGRSTLRTQLFSLSLDDIPAVLHQAILFWNKLNSNFRNWKTKWTIILVERQLLHAMLSKAWS